jgi:murein DD-endopeptidase MepM/ murein hydrolase activator NlpD
MEKEKKRKKIIKKLKNKFRLVIMNDDTFEEKVSFVLSPLNVFVVAGSIVLFLIVSVIYIIAFTNLREYIPGYSSDVNIRRKLINVSLGVDSLQEALKERDKYIENINNIVTGKIKSEVTGSKDSTKKYTNVPLSKTKDDSMLRAEIEAQEGYSLSVNENKSQNLNNNSISSFFFFVPLNGTVTNSYKSTKDHYGVDITAPKNEAIKSTLDGTVVFANWTTETGYVIQIQHDNNLISVYKHNSALLKKVGDRVKAGEVIAIIGDSGELTTGPHLHFELWYNGTSINPQEYMSF